MNKLIMVRGHSPYGHTEQIFDDAKKAHDHMQFLKENGYKEEWLVLPFSTMDEMSAIIKKTLEAQYVSRLY